jgi:hypothetical protein
VLALVVTGVYSVHQSVFEVGLVLGFGVLGYLLRSCKVPPLPIVLGVVLGFMIESNYRRSLLLSSGDHSIFFTDKVSLGLLTLATVLTLYSLWRELGGRGVRKDVAVPHDARVRSESRFADRRRSIAATIASLPRTTPPRDGGDLPVAADRHRGPVPRRAAQRFHAGDAGGDRRARRRAR